MFCPKCGSNVSDESTFCANCGSRIDSASVVETESVETFNQNPPEKPEPKALKFFKEKKKIWVPIVCATVAVIILIVVLVTTLSPDKSRNDDGTSNSSNSSQSSSKPDFFDLYLEYCNYIWADYASDGSYLSIDTNPYDYDDSGMDYIDAYYAIENVNKALGLPQSVLREMEETTWSMGKQTKTYDQFTVSWTYHPDKGLEVLYSLN